MKWISITLAVLLLAASVSADTLYTLPDNDFGDYGLGVDAVGQRVAMTPDGDIILMLDRDVTTQGMYIYLASNYGGTIASYLNPWNVDAQRQSGVLQIADSFWVYPSWSNSTYPVAPRKYVNGSLVVVDTLGTDAANTSGGERGWIAPMDGPWVWLQDVEAGSPDSTVVWQTDATIGSITTVTARQQNALLGGGVRRSARLANVKGGGFAWDHNNERIWVWDSTGLSSIATSVTGGLDLQTPGFGYGKLFCYGDSNVALVYQNGTASNNSLYARLGHATSGATGSPTAISWNTSAVPLVDPGDFPDGHSAYAQVVYCRTDPDSAWVFARTLDADSADISCWFTPDGGSTWDTIGVRREGHNAAHRFRYLQMSEFANIDDTCVWFSGTFSDSGVDATENGYLWIDTLRLAGGGGGGPSPTKRGTGVLHGSLEDQSTGRTLPGRIGEYTEAYLLKREECEQCGGY